MSGELSSAPAPTAEDRHEWVEFVNLTLDEASYFLELGRVEQMLDDPSVTDVPQTGPTIAGVTNLGSEIPVVVDGRALLGPSDRPPSAAATLLLLDRGEARPSGLLVDGVTGIEAHHVDAIRAPGEVDWKPTVGRRWFRAVVESDRTDRPTGVLDAEAVVAGARGQA